MSHTSLPRSGTELVLIRRRSRLAVGLYALELAVLGAAVVLVAAPPYVKALLAVGVLAYGIGCWPRRGPRLVRGSDGRWAVPARGLRDLTLGPGTLYTRQWVRLRLIDARGGGHCELVWADALGPREWRRLWLLLREPGHRRQAVRPRADRRVGRSDDR
jgi:Membrane-bound toxin component of toxin-antitoxin system